MFLSLKCFPISFSRFYAFNYFEQNDIRNEIILGRAQYSRMYRETGFLKFSLLDLRKQREKKFNLKSARWHQQAAKYTELCFFFRS